MRLISIFISVLFFICGTREEEALIFDRFSRSLFQLQNDIPEDLEIGAWAVACPAETTQEKKFTQENSFTNNGLFVKEIYQRGDKMINVRHNVCEKPFKASLVYNVKSLTFQIGFEIYYDLADARYFHTHDPEDYKSPKDIISSVQRYRDQGKFIIKELYRVAKNTVKNDMKELWFNNNNRMGFAWIYLIKFKFDFAHKILEKIMYYIGPNSRWPKLQEKCQDNSLGSEALEGVDNSIYLNMEETIANKFHLSSKINCKSNSECFKRWSIVPISQFRFGPSAAPLCSNMTTIPIWSIIDVLENLLTRIDQYLYALYKAVQEPLHIIAGTTGEVELPKKSRLMKSKVYLDLTKKLLPVPKIIYKIVEYRIKDCKLEEKLCWYSAVIMIHNNPLFDENDRVCAEKDTADWGWDELLENDSKLVYVCPRDEYVKYKLFGITVLQMPTMNSELKLSAFPLSDDGETIKPEDIRGKIRKELNNFKEKGDEPDYNVNTVIEIPRQYLLNRADEDDFMT